MKKKELIGNFKNDGTDDRPKATHSAANVRDQSFNSSPARAPRGCASLTAAKRFTP